MLRHAIRETDFVARYGGEEFAIVLPNTDAHTAKIVANRMLDRVRALQLSHRSSPISDRVTISCGAELAMMNLIARADRALYSSKQAGRD